MAVMSPLDHVSSTAITETAILTRVVDAAPASFAPAAAQVLLALRFPEADRQRMQVLSQRASDGTLTPDEQRELANYRHVGHLLDLLWSRARLSLQQVESDPS